MHAVLRSSRAQGRWNLLLRAREINTLTHSLAKRYRIRIHALANVGNHLHLLIECRSREAFQAFLRAITGRIAMAILGTAKGRPGTKGFWDQRRI
jgi:REP element-mobilizing transposase RayT